MPGHGRTAAILRRSRSGPPVVSPPEAQTDLAAGAVCGLAAIRRWRASREAVRPGTQNRGWDLSDTAAPTARCPCQPGWSAAVSGAGGPRIVRAAAPEPAASRAWPLRLRGSPVPGRPSSHYGLWRVDPGRRPGALRSVRDRRLGCSSPRRGYHGTRISRRSGWGRSALLGSPPLR